MNDVPRTSRFSISSAAVRLLVCAVALGPLTARALDFTASSGAAYDCSRTRPQLRAAAVAYLEPAPLSTIDDYGGNQYSPDDGRNIGLAVGFAELSVGLGAYCLGALYRTEFEGDVSRDLLDVLHGNHNDVTFDGGRAYSLEYETEALSATGLRLRRVFPLGAIGSFDVRLGMGISALKAISARWESMTGRVTADSADYATGTAVWLRRGTEISAFNPFVSGEDAKGYGYSTDLHLRAVSAGNTTIDIIAMDLYGRMHWQDVRDSMRVLNNAAIRYDANANREAFVTGRDRLIDTATKIPTKYRIAVSQPVSSAWSVLAADDFVDHNHFVSLGAQYGTVDRFVATVFDIRTQAIGISAQWDGLAASVMSDRLEWRNASTLAVNLAITTRW